MRDLPNLDFIRACAVLSVVAEHLLLAYGVQWIGPWEVQWIGVVGVFIFFVHTSLVLMWSMERKPHTLDFYIRRAFRIYPLAMVAFAIALALHVPVGGTPEHYFRFLPPPHPWTIPVKSFLLIPNLGKGEIYQPVSVMWSLPFEVEMYVGLPLLFFFVQRNFSLWPLLVLFALVVLANLGIFGNKDGHTLIEVVPYFLPGVMAYVGFSRMRAKMPFWLLPFYLVLLWTWFMLKPHFMRADFLCLALGLGLPLFHQTRVRPLIRTSHAIAKYSYGIYLSHPFAIVLGLYCMPRAPLALQLTVVLVATAAFSIAAYHLLELSLIRLGSRLANKAEQRYEQHELSRYRIPEAEIG